MNSLLFGGLESSESGALELLGKNGILVLLGEKEKAKEFH